MNFCFIEIALGGDRSPWNRGRLARESKCLWRGRASGMLAGNVASFPNKIDRTLKLKVLGCSMHYFIPPIRPLAVEIPMFENNGNPSMIFYDPALLPASLHVCLIPAGAFPQLGRNAAEDLSLSSTNVHRKTRECEQDNEFSPFPGGCGCVFFFGKAFVPLSRLMRNQGR